MRSSRISCLLGATLLVATGNTFETEKHQLNASLAQTGVQHLVTTMPGTLQPCRDSVTQDLIVCPRGQFVWRTMNDMNEDCDCRYELQNCDHTWEAFDTVSGTCICVQQNCPANHSWDFDICGCACDQIHECNDQLNGRDMIWDSQLCMCVCIPEESTDSTLTWNLQNCEFECIITACEDGQSFNYEICGCECEPLACPPGQEFFRLHENASDPTEVTYCGCLCAHQDCPSNFYFDSVDCECKCEPYECPATYYFNSEHCECLCQDPGNCDANQYWSTASCGCECDPTNALNSCPPNGDKQFYLDVETCSCICSPPAAGCDAGYIWIYDVCDCVCCPMVCPDNFYWNNIDCECQCQPVTCADEFYWNIDSCRCECIIQPNCDDDEILDQNNYYYFDSEECKCHCYQPNPETRCVDESEDVNSNLYGLTLIYDADSCQCICEPQHCDAGQFWSQQWCRCVCAPEICPTSYYFRTDIENADNCGCFCKPHFCVDGYHWDEDVCDCVCSPPADDFCPETYYWDSENCRCRCTPLDCSDAADYSTYDSDLCACKCVENPQEPCNADQYFDHASCGCLCAPNQACNDGYYWDTRICGCMEEHCSCPVGYYWNYDSHDCECLPQPCATTFEWNSSTCSCQCQDKECSDLINGFAAFFDPSSCRCRCYYQDDAQTGYYFDMDLCEYRIIPDCPPDYYWDESAKSGEGECVCAMKAPITQGVNAMTWNINTCQYDCIPEVCKDDTYYWDSVQCACACYVQECPTNYFWHKSTCRCICNGRPIQWDTETNVPVYQCPFGLVWDETCCQCVPCQDQGLCADDEFFNPQTCECMCLPICCPEGTTFNYSRCACDDSICDPITQMCNFLNANADLLTIFTQTYGSDCSAFLNANTDAIDCISLGGVLGTGLEEVVGDCNCQPANQTPTCIPGEVFNYDIDACPGFNGGIHFNGCDNWLQAPIDGDYHAFNGMGNGFMQYETSGDECLDVDGSVYEVNTMTISATKEAATFFDAQSGEIDIQAIINENSLPLPHIWNFREDPKWLNEKLGGINSFTNRGLDARTHYDNENPTLSEGTEDAEGNFTPTIQGTLINWGSGFETYATSDYEVVPDTISSFFNGLKHEYYYKLRSAQRNLKNCSAQWLGIDEASCGGESVDAKLVAKADAQMMKFTLHKGGNDSNCYWWTIQIAEPESDCFGYYIDLNPNGPTMSTKFTKTPVHEGVQFYNDVRDAPEMNIWNANPDNTPDFWMPYFQNGYFQIPRTYIDGRYHPYTSNYCNCSEVQAACYATFGEAL